MRISVWWVKMIHAVMLGESRAFDGCILQFPYICSYRSGRGCRGEGSVPGPVPGLLIAGCRIQAGSVRSAKLRDAAVNTSEQPEPDSLMWAPWWDGAGAWPRARGQGLLLSWCYVSPSAAPEPG